MHHTAPACLLIVSLLALGACQKTTGSVYGVAATSGVEHTEPVQFNDQRYLVTFKYESSFAGYNVATRRPQKPLRNTEADKSASIEVMSSALTHFACANGQKTRVVPGSASYLNKRSWAIRAKCA